MIEKQRRMLQAILYEVIGIVITTPLIALFFKESTATSFELSVIVSLIAVSWNYVFNSLFERWESQQVTRGRSLQKRIIHAIGFEGGLILFTVPLIMWFLHLNFVQALLTDLALTISYMMYTVVFTWLFDLVFGLPESAR